VVYRLENAKSRFLALAGLTQENPAALEDAIRDLLANYDAIFERHDRYGDFYQVEGVRKGEKGVTYWLSPSG
jgi:hypothetical protein